MLTEPARERLEALLYLMLLDSYSDQQKEWQELAEIFEDYAETHGKAMQTILELPSSWRKDWGEELGLGEGRKRQLAAFTRLVAKTFVRGYCLKEKTSAETKCKNKNDKEQWQENHKELVQKLKVQIENQSKEALQRLRKICKLQNEDLERRGELQGLAFRTGMCCASVYSGHGGLDLAFWIAGHWVCVVCECDEAAQKALR